MECRVKPYDGMETCVAIIHAIEDDAAAIPLIERLYREGIRVWHDLETRKVMIDYNRGWREQHDKCKAFLVLMSIHAVNSHIFRERFSNAVESKTPTIVVLTMPTDALSPGMRLQIRHARLVVQSSTLYDEKLYEQIIGIQEIADCKGPANSDFEVSPYPDPSEGKQTVLPNKGKRISPPTEQTLIELNGGAALNLGDITAKCDPKENSEEPAQQRYNNENSGNESANLSHKETDLESTTTTPEKPLPSSLEKTLKITNRLSMHQNAMDLDTTVRPENKGLPVILSLSTKEKKRGILGEATVGRFKKTQSGMADIVFDDPCKLFSGRHFQLIFIDNTTVLICKHPNGMNVNGQEMKEGDRYTLDSEALIQIPSNETLSLFPSGKVTPTYLIVAEKERALVYLNTETIAFLQSLETGEARCFTEEFCFGRNTDWKTGVLQSRNISRDHGKVHLEEDHYVFEDHSLNGTLINGNMVLNETVALSDQDIISVQGDDEREERFVFHCCFFKGVD